MSKRHDAIFEDVLKDLNNESTPGEEDRGGTRFLRRSNALADVGEREEKVLRWVDPALCIMWDRHNRAYDLLNEDNCRDLIDSIKSQGQQEFPAIVRKLRKGHSAEYEVICGARRHFAVSWLRANNYPQFRYLIEVRDLSDEEAFRLADVENRDREDISDFERARDYAAALEQYYGGRQKAMAERLEVSEGWLSRYLNLARLPDQVVAAYPSIREIKELHARVLKPLLADPKVASSVMQAARDLAERQAAARAGQGAPIEASTVLSFLKSAASGPKRTRPPEQIFRGDADSTGVTLRKRGSKVVLEFSDKLSDASLRAAFEAYLANRSAGRK
ncbi:ParB/RepB/Spo0J family partition protein [Frigidibacter sp. RF13]|uniref:ParB/RepB/Spo0J family partition protein n=1 Tax=Frigidibacter sp. RF13 TaxID=2997340 RepID=UPI00226DA21C|nr:ParB/RepB/Spo0J family partition protein [Frigidibacter sp. RF13]MCY1128437.1 ParB/RepB/Spo0J family partition protein [Frigidibacter sp. RF13]